MNNLTKRRIIYLYQHLLQKTDSDYAESTAELAKMLKEEYGIKVSRNTISDDLTILHKCDPRIEVYRSSQNRYYYDGRQFNIPELKILIDAVSSSKFVTEKKSKELIKKILSLTPEQNANKLERHIYAAIRIKSDNEKVYYIIDAINDAIDTGHKIRFYYTEYDVYKKRQVTNSGFPYTVSPYTMIWDGDYYYLRGYCDERESMRTFRLDRIEKQPEILNENAILAPKDYNLMEYEKSVFQMFDTDKTISVSLLCHVSTMKSLIDNFGIDVDTQPVDLSYFKANVSVCPSPTFYGWVFSFNGRIRILEPQEIIDEYLIISGNVIAQYS